MSDNTSTTTTTEAPTSTTTTTEAPAPAAKASKATTPAPIPAGVTVPYEAYRAQEALKAQFAAQAADMDETTPGGRYQQPDGTFVDANGKELKGNNAGDADKGEKD